VILASIIIIVLLAVLAYVWIGYPVLLALAAACKKRCADPSQPGGAASRVSPERVTVLIAAHNEEDVIRGRLENLVATCAQAVHVHVGTDGCGDRTASIAREFAKNHPNTHIHEFLENRGKTAVLKDLVQIAERVPELQGSRVAEREEGSPQRLGDRNEKPVLRPDARSALGTTQGKRATSNEHIGSDRETARAL